MPQEVATKVLKYMSYAILAVLIGGLIATPIMFHPNPTVDHGMVIQAPHKKPVPHINKAKWDCKKINQYVHDFGKDMVVQGARQRGMTPAQIKSIERVCKI